MLIRQVAALRHVKITNLYSQIMSDSVAVEMFAISQPFVKIFRKV